MDIIKLKKKGERLQRITKLYNIILFFQKRVGKKRFIDTCHGKVKVLEYGFESSKTAPLFVDLHGGGFMMQSAEWDEQMCRYFHEITNVKIINIDYPKAPKNQYPVAIEAVYDVIKHYVDNAAYMIDPTRIGIGGHSAGANLSAVMCIRAKERGDLSFKFQILDFPPVDMVADIYKKNSPEGAVKPETVNIINACYFNNDTELAKSPYISPVFATKKQLTGLPPALLIIAGRDSLYDEGIVYREMLTQAGVPVEFHEFKDSIHGFTYLNKPDAKKAHAIMADYIKKNT